MPKNREKTHNGYHLFFSEERARIMKSEGSSNAFTKKTMLLIAKKWRFLDALTRATYEVRSQEESKLVSQKATGNETLMTIELCRKQNVHQTSTQSRKEKKAPYRRYITKNFPKNDADEELNKTKNVPLYKRKLPKKNLSGIQKNASISKIDFSEQQLSMIITIGELQTFRDSDLVDFVCSTFA